MDNVSAINLNDQQIRINTLLTELWDLPFCLPLKGFYVVLVQKLTSGTTDREKKWSLTIFVESPDFFVSLLIFFYDRHGWAGLLL